MHYRFLALDLDGTLTNSRKVITEGTKTVLKKYQECGGTVILASGRPAYGILPLAETLELHKYGGYILAFNGGQIINCKNRQVVWQKVMPSEVIADLYKLAADNQVTMVTYENENIITENPDDPYVLKEMAINSMSAKRVDSFVKYVTFPVAKCLMTGDGEYLAGVEKRAKETFRDRLSIFRSEPFFLEIMPEGIDKAESLERLLTRLGAYREQMAACGDGFNDMTMIEYAGLGIAMENGQDCVKKAADFIAPSNDKDGVAWVVENKLL